MATNDLIESYERTMGVCEQTRLPEAMEMLDWLADCAERGDELARRDARGRLETLRACLPSLRATLAALEAHGDAVEGWLDQGS